MAGPESPFTEAQLDKLNVLLSHHSNFTAAVILLVNTSILLKTVNDLAKLSGWRDPPSSMAELRATINSLAERMSPAEIRKAVNNVSKRAEACIAVSGDNFEHLLKKARRDVEE